MLHPQEPENGLGGIAALVALAAALALTYSRGGIVAGAASSLTFDAAGCPALDEATASTLVQQLQTAPDGSAAKDGFANFNVLALVLVVDKTILTQGGPILSVSASTNK